MKYLIFLVSLFLLFACSNSKSVYWCGDHACINNKEKEAYFKKTMIVEVRELGKQDQKDKSNLEIIKEQTGLKEKIINKQEKELSKQIRQEEKIRIKEAKKLAKQARLEEKIKIKEAKKLAKQARLEEKMRIKKEKKSSKQKKAETVNTASKKEVLLNSDIAPINLSSAEFAELVESVKKKNMLRPFPNINDIPN